MKLVTKVPYLYSYLYVLSIILSWVIYACVIVFSWKILLYVYTAELHNRGCLKFTLYTISQLLLIDLVGHLLIGFFLYIHPLHQLIKKKCFYVLLKTYARQVLAFKFCRSPFMINLVHSQSHHLNKLYASLLYIGA